jgi:hypothetical protein
VQQFIPGVVFRRNNRPAALSGKFIEDLQNISGKRSAVMADADLCEP